MQQVAVARPPAVVAAAAVTSLAAADLIPVAVWAELIPALARQRAALILQGLVAGEAAGDLAILAVRYRAILQARTGPCRT